MKIEYWVEFSKRIKKYLNDNPAVLWIFSAALLVRFVDFLIYHNDFWYKTYLIDDCIFYSWAHSIANGDILSISKGVFRLNPGYPYTLALIIKLFGKSTFVPHIAQYIVGSLSAVLIYIAAKKMFGKPAALISGLIAAFYGMSVFYEGKLLGSVWIMFFNLLLLIFLLKWETKQKKVFLSVAGLMLGISSLYLPTVVVFIPFVIGWIFLVSRKEQSYIRNAVVRSFIFIGAILVVMLPVMIRNYVIDKKFGLSLTTSSGGINFFIGNNPEANGYNAWPSFIRYSPEAMHDDFKLEAEKRLNRQLSDNQVSSFWFIESLKWMQNNPVRALNLLFNKAVYFCNATEPPDNFMTDSVVKFTRIFGIPLISWGILAPFAIVGFVLVFIERKGILVALYLISYFVSNVMFYILSRYRFPASIAVIIFAGFSIYWILEQFKNKKWKLLIGIALIIAVLYSFIYKKVVEGELEYGKHYSIGVIYMNTGNIDGAIEEYKKSISYNQEFAPARINLGNIYLNRNEFMPAVEQYLEAVKYDEKNKPEIFRIVGEIYGLKLNDYEQALKYLGQSAESGNLTAFNSMGEVYIASERYKNARAVYEELLKEDPNNHMYVYKLGLTYFYTGELKKAKELFARCVELKPDFEDAKNAIIYIERNRR